MSPARIAAALVSTAAFIAPAMAFAQQPAGAVPTPSYARPPASGEETIHGIVRSFDGKYRLEVRDDRGFVDNVELHQGTVINPTGLTLRPGMAVTIMGFNRGSTLAANEIDTPYQLVPLVSPYAYPDFSFGFGFGPVFRHH